MLGTYVLSAGYYDAYYGQAQRVRTLVARGFADAYERFDVLVGPTSPTVAFEIGAKTQTRWRCTCPTSTRSRRTSPATRR